MFEPSNNFMFIRPFLCFIAYIFPLSVPFKNYRYECIILTMFQGFSIYIGCKNSSLWLKNASDKVASLFMYVISNHPAVNIYDG